MKFCINCGSPLPEGAKFCGECGQRVAQKVTPAPAPAPVYEAPAHAPVYEAPAPAPVHEAPAPAPVQETPAPAPVYEAPAPAPVYEAPALAPVYEAPAPAPVYEAPAPAPVYEAPAPAPVYEAPAPAPVYEAPAPAPVHEAPAPAPVIQEPAAPVYAPPAAPKAAEPQTHVYGAPVAHTFSAPKVSESEQSVVHTYGAPVAQSFAPPVQSQSALSGSYTVPTAAAPVETAPVRPAAKPAAPVRPAAKPAAKPAAAPVATREKPAKPALPKLNLNSRMIRIGLVAVLAVALIVGLISCIAGGGKKNDPNLGVYNGVSCTYAGMELGADGEWIELKSGGKLKMMLMGEEYSGKWELEGEDLTITQAGDSFYGTLRNGVLTLDLSGVIYIYEKEVTAEDAPETPAAAEVGYWTLKYAEGDEAFAMDEETVAMLKSMGLEIFLDMRADGTGTFMMEEPMEITWSKGSIKASDGSKASYTLENGELILEIEGAILHFVPGEGSAPVTGGNNNGVGTYVAVSGNMNGTELNDSTLAQMGGVSIVFNGDGTGTMSLFGQTDAITYDETTITKSGISMSYELDGDYLYFHMSSAIEFVMVPENGTANRPAGDLTPNDLGYWAGDYYGWWVVDNVITGNPDAEGNWWDCCMTLDIASDGTGYITIWDEDYGKDDPIAEVSVSVSVHDGVARIVSESGQFMGMPVNHADWLFYSDSTGYDDTLGFFAVYEDSEMKIENYFFLRRWGTIWNDVSENDMPYYYEDWYLPLIEAGVTVAPETIG